MTREELNKCGKAILDACIAVHRQLGPGLLESVYVSSLLKEFEMRNIRYKSKLALPALYKGFDTGKFFEIDILVENEIILEIKAVEELHPIHVAQLLTYLRLSEKRLGYLINFNTVRLIDGFKRYVNKI